MPAPTATVPLGRTTSCWPTSRSTCSTGRASSLATTRTDANGNYTFTGLAPGEYQVFEHQPAGYFDGVDHPGTAGGRSDGVDTILGIVLASGTNAERYNFCEHVGVTLSGHVYHDASNDAQRDTDEQGIGGVTLMLLDADGRDTGIRATTSTADHNRGAYQFSQLAAGTYGIAEAQPAGYLDGLDTPGNRGGRADNPGDRIVDAVLAFGQRGEDYNFGELLPGSISGFVFQDGPALRTVDGVPSDVSQLRDGVLTGDDRRLAGVTLELRHGASGAPIMASDVMPGRYADGPIRTTTDARGYYEFTGLPGGTYAVFEIHPTAYIDGIDTPGSLGGFAVNPHAPPSPWIMQQLTVDPANDAILRIPLPAGQSSTHNNFSEVLVEPFAPPPPPPEALRVGSSLCHLGCRWGPNGSCPVSSLRRFSHRRSSADRAAWWAILGT